MKKIILTLIAITFAINFSYAQNTFPSSGNVGIGTTTPSRQFVISNSGAEGIELQSVSAGGFANLISYNRNTSAWGDFKISASNIIFGWGSTETNEAMRINSSGNIGIGTTTPSTPLQVNGTIFSASPISNTASIGVTTAGNLTYNFIGYAGYWGLRTATNTSYNLDVYNGGNPITAMTVLQGGNIGIGTTTPDQKLTVKGTIHSQEVLVDLNVPGPDYVFEPAYKLPTLSELKTYVDQNHHLPEIPSAEQMTKDGLSLGDMNVKLLKKVEELTLYLIEENKQNKNQQNEINELRKQLNILTKALNKK